MELVKYPERNTWTELVKRPAIDAMALQAQVLPVLQSIQQDGDTAVKKCTLQFDGVVIHDTLVNATEINHAATVLPAELKAAIETAAANILKFHEQQLHGIEEVETMPGILCWRKSIGIEKVGLYIPGGSAPLFSTVLMLGIPAVIAGCKEIILCTPPSKDGSVHPAILYAASIAGIQQVYKIGGVQAIGAMAYGTATVPQVYKIFGPGNQYVTCAKQLIQMQGVAIDMPAGPSEVCVLADETANAAFVAADLLSQAEHGTDSQVLLIATSETVIDDVQVQLEKQLSVLPRKDIAAATLTHSKAVLVKDIDEGIALANAYAAEHLIICCEYADQLADKIVNAGSVFLGNYSPESVGDYASGTNHTLPTNGFARAFSGVSIDSFVKKVTYQQLTKEGLQSISDTVTTMATAEGLQAHANAVNVRLRP